MSELISVALGGRPASCSSKTEATLSVDWVAEGFTLVLLGVLVAAVTMRGGSADPVTQAVYAVASGALLVFAVWTAATAARGSVISNTPGRPARGSAEPTLSTAAAGFARGSSLRAGSWSARPRAPKRTASPRPGRVPVTV